MLIIICIMIAIISGIMIASMYLGLNMAFIAISSSTITTILLIIILSIKNKIDIKKAEESYKEKDNNYDSKNKELKNELLSYYKEGYVITEKIGKFKLTKKTKKLYVDVSFINKIYVIDNYSNDIKKAYKITYKVDDIFYFMPEKQQRKYRVNRTFLVHGL